MKKVYVKPEITTNAYAQFENVLTWGCSKMFISENPKNTAGCEGRDEWTRPPYQGQSDFPCNPSHGVAGMQEIGS